MNYQLLKIAVINKLPALKPASSFLSGKKVIKSVKKKSYKPLWDVKKILARQKAK